MPETTRPEASSSKDYRSALKGETTTQSYQTDRTFVSAVPRKKRYIRRNGALLMNTIARQKVEEKITKQSSTTMFQMNFRPVALWWTWWCGGDTSTSVVCVRRTVKRSRKLFALAAVKQKATRFFCLRLFACAKTEKSPATARIRIKKNRGNVNHQGTPSKFSRISTSTAPTLAGSVPLYKMNHISPRSASRKERKQVL